MGIPMNRKDKTKIFIMILNLKTFSVHGGHKHISALQGLIKSIKLSAIFCI